ncbi:MAG: hypothetical protein EA369_09745 [Bradymonadales bacterium]|nr:MAG: hypothetical protein EA369_09745 [Bradymonadales bacterium]
MNTYSRSNLGVSLIGMGLILSACMETNDIDTLKDNITGALDETSSQVLGLNLDGFYALSYASYAPSSHLDYITLAGTLEFNLYVEGSVWVGNSRCNEFEFAAGRASEMQQLYPLGLHSSTRRTCGYNPTEEGAYFDDYAFVSEIGAAQSYLVNGNKLILFGTKSIFVYEKLDKDEPSPITPLAHTSWVLDEARNRFDEPVQLPADEYHLIFFENTFISLASCNQITGSWTFERTGGGGSPYDPAPREYFQLRNESVHLASERECLAWADEIALFVDQIVLETFGSIPKATLSADGRFLKVLGPRYILRYKKKLDTNTIPL